MKKILLGIILSLILVGNCFGASQWDKANPAGTTNASDIDSYLTTINNEAADRLLYTYRQDCALVYASASTITVKSGALALPNAAGTIVRWRRNTSNTTVAWTEIDAGAEANSTTYYVYGLADTDATTFTCKISTNSSAPTGATYYRRLGSFYNDASGNITNISNDNFIGELGSWETKSSGTTYQATTDGFVCALVSDGGTTGSAYGYTDNNAIPTTIRGGCDYSSYARAGYDSFMFPVKKGDYWKIVVSGFTATVYWIPLD